MNMFAKEQSKRDDIAKTLRNPDNHHFSGNEKSTSTTSTINTDAGYGASLSALSSALDQKSADENKLKDSILAEIIAENLKNTLCFD